MPSASDAVAAATMEDAPADTPGVMVAERRQPKARAYQRDLVDIALNNNVIISLATGAGKTLIAAEVIRQKLPELHAARKAVLFMAPTNPLVAQQCDEALGKTHGFRTRAYHGSLNNQRLSQWNRDKWDAVLAETDVLVMTPDVLLHTLSHGVFRMSDIGMLIFDEAHHCKSDHPYNQLLQDFYHTLQPNDRPQILGLTASPDCMEKDERRRKGKPFNMGLQHNMNAFLVTVPSEGPLREELNNAVPCPSAHVLNYKSTPANGVIADSLAWLNWMKDYLLKPAKRCEAICEVLCHQELLASAGLADAGIGAPSFEGFLEGSRVASLDKQIRGVLYCLEHLGPWCAAAAAYLDLLAPPAEYDAEEEEQAIETAEEDNDDDDDDDDNDDDSAGLDVPLGGDSGRMVYDDLAGPPDVLTAELRRNLGQIVHFLRIHAEQPELSVIITQAELDDATTPRPQDLPAAKAAAEAARALAEQQKAATPGEVGGLVTGAIGTCSDGNELEWCARGVLKLASKVSLLVTMNVLADVLVDDKDWKNQLMQQAGGNPGCVAVEHRLSGSLQGFAEVLLRRVPFNLLEAQVWPELHAEDVPPWHGPPLLTDKVVTLLRLLDEDRRRCESAAEEMLYGMDCEAAGQTAEVWWACMVFVETKLSALVLSKLLASLPSMRKQLRAGYLLGDTRQDGTAGGLAMNNKQQAQVVAGFRNSAINVLIATSVGSEGMDFKQCQLVVAFDLPRDVTAYIQCRGRARKAGSRYCFMQQEEQKLNIYSLIKKAGALEARAKEISEQNRITLAEHPGLKLRTEADAIQHGSRLETPCGALVTLRLAQQMLSGYCSKLPGSDSVNMLHAYYSTRVSAGLFHTVIYLPSNSGIPSKIDDAPPGLSSKQSKQQAALRALQLLYAAGKLNDNLQPVWVTQKHHKQLAAEPVPDCTAEIRLHHPLHVQLLEPKFTAAAAAAAEHTASSSSVTAERTITLHLHTFKYGRRAKQGKRSKARGSSAKVRAAPAAADAAAAVAEAYTAAETSLLAAVVGSDDALAALPGGPAVAVGMKAPVKQLCFGVLLWEQLPGGLMQWPVWIEQKLHVMDVVYEGPMVLLEPQVQQLLGYQSVINKHINWAKTRAAWLKQARDVDKQEAAAAAAVVGGPAATAGDAADVLLDSVPGVDRSTIVAAAAATNDIDIRTTAASGDNAMMPTSDAGAAAEEEAGYNAAAGAAADATQPDGAAEAGAEFVDGDGADGEEQQQRQPMLPFKPALLKSIMRWDRAKARTAVDVAAAAAAARAQQTADAAEPSAAATAFQQDRAAQPAGGDVEGVSEPWLPPDKLSYLIVPIVNNDSQMPAAAGGNVGGTNATEFCHARGKLLAGLTAAKRDTVAVNPAGEPTPAVAGAEWSSSTDAAGSSSKDTAVQIDWDQVNMMAAGLQPLGSFIAAACGLSAQHHIEATRMELPPPVPPPALKQTEIAAALAAGLAPPLHGAAAMAPMPPALKPDALQALEAALLGRVVVAGHSSHVYCAVGIASGLTPASSMSAAVERLSVQMSFSNGIDIKKQRQTLDDSDLPSDRAGMPTAAGTGLGDGAASCTSKGCSGDTHNHRVSTAGNASSANACANSAIQYNSSAPLLISNPEMVAALLLSSSMVEHDPEKRPLLGWKVGKTEDGKPVWRSADRHDEYYRLRCGITGLRPDLPMLAVKSSRGLTESCLLPPKARKNSITLPGLGKPQPAAAHAAAAAAAASPAAGDGSSDPAAMDMDDVGKAGGVPAHKAVWCANGDSVADGSSASVAAAGRNSPKRGSCSDVLDPSAWQAGPDKRRKLTAGTKAAQTSAAPAADADSTACYVVDGVDRAAQYELQQAAVLLHSALPAAIAEQSMQLATMSRSGRRKLWAQHRVVFLPLELVWLLPVTSSEWSQLQMLPSIVYRLDSMLAAVGFQKKLQALLHGGNRKADDPGGQPPNMYIREGAEGVAMADQAKDVLAEDGQEQPLTCDWAQPASLLELLPELSDRVPPLTGEDAADRAAAPDDTGVAAGDESAAADGSAGTAAAVSPAAEPTSKQQDLAELGHGRAVPLPTPRLLLLALTASSCHEAFDLERLEFLGDVVLKVLATCCLLKMLPPDANEGELSVAKARLVRNARLAQLGSTRPLLLQYLLRFHAYDSNLWTPTGSASTLGVFRNGPLHTYKGKKIADVVESLIGAFYLAGSAQEAAEATTGPASGFAHGMQDELHDDTTGGQGLHNAAAWVWNRVSRPGLIAAATFCEAVGVLPPGAARTLAGSPMPLPSKESQPTNQLSLLHPSYTAAVNNFFENARGSAAGAGTQQPTMHEHLVNKLHKMTQGPFPHAFKNTTLLAQAVTHVSVLGSQSYQRLEFLGDALLDLIVSLRSLAKGRGEGYHLGPAELTKWRASIVSNNTLSTAAVMTGLHNLLRANNWRLLLGVRMLAADVRAKYSNDKPTDQQGALDKETAATALQLAANSSLLRVVATAAGPSGGSNVLTAAARASTEAVDVVTAVAADTVDVRLKGAVQLAQDVLDDDGIWAAVWMRKKDVAAMQAAAHVAALAMVKSQGNLDKAVSTVTAAGNDGTRDTGDVDMQAAGGNIGGSSSQGDAASAGGDAEGSGEDSGKADGEAAGANVRKKKIKLPKVMADLIEALTAAVYCDSGGDWDPTWAAVNYMLFLHQAQMKELQLQLPPPKRADMGTVLSEDDSDRGE